MRRRLVGDELFLELMDVVSERDHAGVFRFVGKLLHEGYDLAEFYRGLADFLRALLLVKLSGAAAAEIRRAGKVDRVIGQAIGFGLGVVVATLSLAAGLGAAGEADEATCAYAALLGGAGTRGWPRRWLGAHPRLRVEVAAVPLEALRRVVAGLDLEAGGSRLDPELEHATVAKGNGKPGPASSEDSTRSASRDSTSPIDRRSDSVSTRKA